jgi:pyruvate formate lyase activating enzyme
MRGIVFDIQRASLHDGPGLRTTVFLKGCPLRCAWCHNPESQTLPPQRGKSGKVYGREMSREEVMATVLADRSYYQSSGGGLTLSGGEPTVQYAFCHALLQAAREEGIHTCLDTCGQVPTDRLLALLPLVDLFHFDWKLSAPDPHREWTGVDGELIGRNLRCLIGHRARIILRCPIIPGINDDPAHAKTLAEWEAHPGIEALERLPYHPIGEAKYTDLCLDRPRLPAQAGA